MSALDRQSHGVVFLVPGQGGDPRGALHGLYRTTAEARHLIDSTLTEIEQASDSAGPNIRELLLETGPHNRLGSGVPQLANYAISIVLAKIIISTGITPRAIVGQSFGEIAALVCAGVFDPSEGARAVCALNAAFRGLEGRGGMVLVFASERDTRALLDEVGRPDLVIACINTPEQTIISGPTDAIDEVRSRARSGVRLIALAVPYASHHPGLHPVAERFKAGLAPLRQRLLRVPVHSPVRRRAYTDADDLHAALADCVVKPVHLPETLEHVAAQGTTLFIELGAGEILTRCVRATLPGSHAFAPLDGDLSWVTRAPAPLH